MVIVTIRHKDELVSFKVRTSDAYVMDGCLWIAILGEANMLAYPLTSLKYFKLEEDTYES